MYDKPCDSNQALCALSPVPNMCLAQSIALPISPFTTDGTFDAHGGIPPYFSVSFSINALSTFSGVMGSSLTVIPTASYTALANAAGEAYLEVKEPSGKNAISNSSFEEAALYDLGADIAERKNLAAAKPKKRQELLGVLKTCESIAGPD